MITISGAMGRGIELAVCSLIPLMMLGGTPATAENGGNTPADASALIDLVTRPGPPGRATQGHFENNVGCVSAKLDVWFMRGRHTHQLFTLDPEQDQPRSRPLGDRTPSPRPAHEGDAAKPSYHDVMDADGTTIFVGREGCRIRIRIDRAE